MEKILNKKEEEISEEEVSEKVEIIKQEKKPIYKKWWFWLIIGLVILGIISLFWISNIFGEVRSH
tara:strand:+ start:70 stop:264 length:195 start_codon:yes stop_codon:yes gene_type:complete